ncbi:MAG TPA: 2-oxoglutarate and iron-dependent oxygenase domain-containing protein, partial [Chlamydiales bacterium]|nr:2-oxoglutarate and iron-dependent oxygenase domain-containing protein [Chlamydiales bacterium]
MIKTIVCTALLLTGLNLNAETTVVPQEYLDISIPIVDMQDFYNTEKQEEFINTLHKALTEIGFFAVRNTGIDRDVIKKAYAQAEIFFQRDAEYKAQSFLPLLNGQRGFVP